MKGSYKKTTDWRIFSLYLRVFLPVIAVLGVALWFVNDIFSQNRLASIEAEELQDVSLAQQIINSDLDTMQRDVLYLSSHNALLEFLDSGRADSLSRFGSDLVSFARFRRFYDQIRYLDNNGQERLRINRQKDDPYLVAANELQNKGDRYYVRETAKLSKGQLYLSTFDLNVEHGQIELPYKPVIRVGTPVYNRRGIRQGMIIVNYLGQDLLNKLREIRKKTGGDLWLVNAQGDWLLGPSPELEWGFMFGLKEGRFATTYPEIWKGVAAKMADRPINWRGALFTLKLYEPTHDIATSYAERWLVVAHLPAPQLTKMLRGRSYFVLLTLLGLTLLPTLVIGGLSYYFAHRWAEPILQESEDRFRTLFESAPDAILIADTEGRMVLANHKVEQLFGYSNAELIGAKVELLIPDEIRDKHVQYRQQYLDSPNPSATAMNSERPGRHKDGRSLPLEFNLGTVETRHGRLVITIIRDKQNETRINKLNAELTHRTKELETINHELESFCYAVSHDLRAPLRAIDGFSRTLVTNYAEHLDETGQDRLNRIRAAAQRMAALIDDLLKLSRISRQQLQREHTDLSQIAHRVVEELRVVEPERPVEIEIEPNLTCLADQNLIHVAMNNLLGNAWKFTSKNAAARIEVGALLREHERVFFVKDNGAGFDMRYANKLFGAFQRLHEQQEFPGTGVGLATVQRVIHKHGGKIWAESEPGKGATFYFTMDSGGDLT